MLDWAEDTATAVNHVTGVCFTTSPKLETTQISISDRMNK